MSFSIIAAVDTRLVIGNKNDLPWGRIPADMKHFRTITAGHTVVMGQRTFESIGSKPLPKRRNIILSNNPAFTADGCEIAHSIDEAKKLSAHDGEVFVIGGASIFKQFLPFVETMYITFIEGNFEGDTYFPAIDPALWEKTSEEIVKPSPENKYQLRFVIYKRKV